MRSAAAEDKAGLTTYRLTGLDCADCAAKLEKMVNSIDGVSSAQINFGASKIVVEHSISDKEIIRAIDKAGYIAEVDNKQNKAELTVLRLTGLDCADCAAKLEQKVSQIPGVASAKLNFGASKLTVEHHTVMENIIRTVQESGYGVEQDESEPGAGESGKPPLNFWQKNRKVLLTAVSGAAVGAGFLLSLLGVSSKILIPIYLTAMITGGFYVARTGLYALRTFSLDMNFLMTVAAVGAAAIGEWSEAATVVFLFSLGNALQAYTMEKTRNSIRDLMDLTPKEALVRRDDEELKLPLHKIRIGDIIVTKPGERIAVDGKVVCGLSSVNQAPITGESMPVQKEPGDEVYAGTINEAGSLDIEVTKLAADTTISKIIHLVEEAQAQKAPSQQFVDVFAKYYTPAVIITALAVATLPSLLFAQPFIPWFEKALILLVISCPCALVISTPVAIVAAIGSAAKKGVLIKGGAHLEAAGSLQAMAFDKTGTLTTGRPEVTDVITVNNFSANDIVRIASAIEIRSQHPLAEAIVKFAREKDITVAGGSQFESVTGKGAKAEVDGNIVYIGNARLFEELGVDLKNVDSRITELQKQGKTVMIVGDEINIYGLLAVSDVSRETGARAIKGLKQAGIKKVIMLTGDNPGTAQVIAKQVGVDEFKAELLPADKLTVIKDLTGRFGQVGMVGDGVNDAPALAAATVGIAMGGAGTDTALETADIALLADDLSKLPYTVKLSRQALIIIKENIGFSLIVKAVFLILTFLGMANLWMAVFADTGAALIVIANGMRLLNVKE